MAERMAERAARVRVAPAAGSVRAAAAPAGIDGPATSTEIARNKKAHRMVSLNESPTEPPQTVASSVPLVSVQG
jgi:hypothetical protein